MKLLLIHDAIVLGHSGDTVVFGQHNRRRVRFQQPPTFSQGSTIFSVGLLRKRTP